MFPFIQRDLTYGIIYDGNIKGLDTCYNSNETFKWFSTIKENGNGIVTIKEEEDISEELYKFLVNLATHKQIDDVLFGIRPNFLHTKKK